MVASDSLLGRLALAARPTRPWLRLSLPARWARLLVAAGAQPGAGLPGGAPARAAVGDWLSRFTIAFPRLQAAGASTREAAEDDAASGGRTWRLDEHTTLSAYSPAGLDKVEIAVATTRLDWRDVLLPVRVSGTEYLLALGATVGGARGEIVAETDADTARIELAANPREPVSLTAADVKVVARSVAVSSTAGRALWARTLDRLPERDPVRAAIAAGLR